MPVVIFRPGIVIGRGSSPLHWGVGMWSFDAVCQLWGRGRNPLPLVLVEDVASALVAALDVPGIEGESFNLVAESGLTALDYLEALERSAGVEFQKIPTPPWKFYLADVAKWLVKRAIRHPDRRRPSYRDWETRTQRAHYDCSKARKLLNWDPDRACGPRSSAVGSRSRPANSSPETPPRPVRHGPDRIRTCRRRSPSGPAGSRDGNAPGMGKTSEGNLNRAPIAQ